MNTLTNRLAGAATLLSLALYAPAALAADNLSSTAPGTVGGFLVMLIDFIDRLIVPLVFALAFIVFLWGVFTYFIAGAANEEKRQQGEQFVMYAIIGFVIMFSIWGLVNLVKNTLPLNNSRPDYPTFGAPSGNSGSGSGGTVSLPSSSASDCNTTGCPSGQTCSPISGSYACIPTQTQPTPVNPASGNTVGPQPPQ